MRKRIRLSDADYNGEHAFYLTACTRNRRPWLGDNPVLAGECADRIVTLSQERSTELFAWCVMPDHFHVLLRDASPVEFMRLVKGRTAKAARRIAPGPGLWQRSYFDRALRQEESILAVARYIWGNPVRAGLVNSPTDYQWSGSLAWPGWREEYGRG